MKQFISEEEKQNLYGFSPIEKGMGLLKGKWRIRILYILLYHPSKRYGELKRMLPNITHKMLSNELRELERLGLITRRQYNEMPLRVEYATTEQGQKLQPILQSLSQWIIEL